GRDLPPAHRAADESTYEVLGVIQHELVARLRRNRPEGLEGVGPVVGAIAGYRLDRPLTFEEQFAHPLQLCGAERISDVGLVDDGPGDRPDPIEKRRSRILVRQPRGDRVHRLSARRPRANQLEEVPWLAPFEMQMREKQMLVQ